MALMHFEGFDPYPDNGAAQFTAVGDFETNSIGSPSAAMFSSSASFAHTGLKGHREGGLSNNSLEFGDCNRFYTGRTVTGGDTVFMGAYVRRSGTTHLYVSLSSSAVRRGGIGFGINGSGLPTIVRANVAAPTAVGHVTLWTGAEALPADALNGTSGSLWMHFQLKALLQATATGTVELRINGVTVASLTDVVTTDFQTRVFDGWAIGGAARTLHMDDLWFCDGTGPAPFNDFLGPARVRRVALTGNVSSQWTPSTGSDNAALVNDAPADTATYVEAAASGNTDLYTVEALPAGISPLAVRTHVLTKRATADGLANIRPLISDGSNEVLGQERAVLGDWRHMPQIFETAPDGGAWTPAKVAGLRVGIRRTA